MNHRHDHTYGEGYATPARTDALYEELLRRAARCSNAASRW